jgi:hypothetical protein
MEIVHIRSTEDMIRVFGKPQYRFKRKSKHPRIVNMVKAFRLLAKRK